MHLIALLALVAAVSGACAESVGTPPFQQVKPPGTAVFNCKFDRPITDCRVRVTEHYNKYFDSAVLDFSLGSRSASVGLKHKSGTLLATASYAGSGLAESHCGLGLRVENTLHSLVILAECLGLAADGGWMQGHGLVASYGSYNIFSPNVLIPRLVLAAPGSDVAVLFTAQGALGGCSIQTPAAGYVYVTPSRPLPSDSRYRTHGAGMGHGQCGFTLPNVMQQDAGVWWWLGEQSWSYALQATVVLVLAAPVGDPVLVVPDVASMRVGDLLKATCRAPPSVPPANLAWFLGDAEVRRDSWNDTLPGDVGAKHPWHAQASVQTLTRRVTAADLGKRLECRLQHQGLRDVRSVGHVLTEGAAKAAEVVCPALSTLSVRVRCSLSGVDVDCGNAPAPLGTTALITCREGFKPTENHPGSLNTSCTGRSRWRPKPLNCHLDCGLRRGDAQQLSAGGKKARKSEFPWHVAVFQKQGDSYRPRCGGSLITVNFFVSAAHCFWHPSARTSQNATLYKASLGKHTLPWETRDKHEQRRSVKAIHIPVRYEGTSKKLENDIALVRLSAPVLVTPAVNVVCVDWRTATEYQQLFAGSLGTVPGWGLTENDTQSDVLRFVDLPFVPYAACRDAVPWDFRSHIVFDKVCGGYRNRSTAVCQGDSGGGFVFAAQSLRGTRYFLRAVVSNSPRAQPGSKLRCQAEHMTAFTLVSLHAQWLEGLVFAATDSEEDGR